MVMFMMTLGNLYSPNHPDFYVLHSLSYLHCGWTRRLQIWCQGWS